MASLYCWQHKDQAASSNTWNDTVTPAKPRTSIDTLMDRLGVLEINDKPPRGSQKQKTGQSGCSEKRRPRSKKTLCCFEIVDDDKDSRPPAPVRTPVQKRPTQCRSYTPQTSYQNVRRPASVPRPQHVGVPSTRQGVSSAPQTPSRPSFPNNTKNSSSSQTPSLLSWIPTTHSPQTTSILLTELAKPISTADDEGYIYMFWVTPQTAATRNSAHSPLPRDIASSILPSVPESNNSLRPPPQPRSVSEAIAAARDLNALASNPTSTAPGTIRLKIGRTSNVHRRLSEWTRQCSHDLTLIRYYPYTPSSASSSPARRSAPRQRADSSGRNTTPAASLVAGRKVPHVHRVERLIHLELADLRVRDLGRCNECGKEHREWFEVEAAKEALRRVDECVRRWVSWGESMA
ncbi:uncharacterized protein N7482_002613 [Penicillium canariense]|uniref:Bacteriophage T5 Orf172 DNA-binding domain-containing protein n=1 Tax=Penicillium canariense TaxID=189055 RepID=A0A9W9LU62_9EURO|nr:uncharacterized protein N7482_002613 [Penicillium canariense]KAJ5176736.1 hypothetical protein N7482_002613 [Penicillium canariense]